MPCNHSLSFSPALAGYDANTFAERDELIGRHALELFTQTVGPEYLNLDGAYCSQTKVQTWIVAGIEARLAEDSLRLNLCPVANEDPSADCAAV